MSFKDFNMNMDEYNQQLSTLDANKEEPKQREFKDPTDGEYECVLLNLELGTNKAGDKLMLKGAFKILDGEFKNQRLWINKVLTGTRNDAGCVRACVAFLNSFGAAQEVEFTGDFDDFATQIELVFCDVKNCTFVVEQKTQNDFKNLYINDVYDN